MRRRPARCLSRAARGWQRAGDLGTCAVPRYGGGDFSPRAAKRVAVRQSRRARLVIGDRRPSPPSAMLGFSPGSAFLRSRAARPLRSEARRMEARSPCAPFGALSQPRPRSRALIERRTGLARPDRACSRSARPTTDALQKACAKAERQPVRFRLHSSRPLDNVTSSGDERSHDGISHPHYSSRLRPPDRVVAAIHPPARRAVTPSEDPDARWGLPRGCRRHDSSATAQQSSVWLTVTDRMRELNAPPPPPHRHPRRRQSAGVLQEMSLPFTTRTDDLITRCRIVAGSRRSVHASRRWPRIASVSGATGRTGCRWPTRRFRPSDRRRHRLFTPFRRMLKRARAPQGRGPPREMSPISVRFRRRRRRGR